MGTLEEDWQAWTSSSGSTLASDPTNNLRAIAYSLTASWPMNESVSRRLLDRLHHASQQYLLDGSLKAQCGLSAAALRDTYDRIGRCAGTLSSLIAELGPAERSMLSLPPAQLPEQFDFVSIAQLAAHLDNVAASATTASRLVDVSAGPRPSYRIHTLLETLIPVLEEAADGPITTNNELRTLGGPAAPFLKLYVEDLDEKVKPIALFNAVKAVRKAQRRTLTPNDLPS